MATIIQQDGDQIVFLSPPEEIGIDTSNPVVQVGAQPDDERLLGFARVVGFWVQSSAQLALQPIPILPPGPSS
jgi:hypothetical protein